MVIVVADVGIVAVAVAAIVPVFDLIHNCYMVAVIPSMRAVAAEKEVYDSYHNHCYYW